MSRLQLIPTYAVVATRGDNLPRIHRDFQVIATGLRSLEDALKMRVVSGDLVINTHTLEVSQSDAWLFSWEKRDKNCYAQRMQRLELRHS